MKEEQVSDNIITLGRGRAAARPKSRSGWLGRREDWDSLTQEERRTVLWLETHYHRLAEALVSCDRLAEATGNHPRFVQGGKAITSMLRFMKDFKPCDADLTDSHPDSVPTDAPMLESLAGHGL